MAHGTKARSRAHKRFTPRVARVDNPLPQQQTFGAPVVDPDDRIMTFVEWCEANRFSSDTGRRIIAAGDVEVVQLSKRRIGITAGANRAFHDRRTRKHGGAA